MNIETLSDYIEQFDTSIIDSGFKRDLQDFVASLPNNQTNIVALREIADKVLSKLNEVYGGDLPDSLGKLLPKEIRPFTEQPHDETLSKLINNKEIEIAEFFKQLSQILTQLNQQIQQNITEIENIKGFIEPYISAQKIIQVEEFKAIIAIIFKDKKTISVLKDFLKNLKDWDRTILLYHQILKSSTPEDIKIAGVQNGSIDFVVNIDFDIALNLVELFKIGFKCFMAYLSYRAMAKPIIDSYYGNKKLIAGEKEREKELLNNIGLAVKQQILDQHKEALKTDKDIDKNIDKKTEQVVKLVTSHIIKGNDIKLLSLPETKEKETEENVKTMKKELITVSTSVRQALKTIPPKEMKALLENFKDPNTK